MEKTVTLSYQECNKLAQLLSDEMTRQVWPLNDEGLKFLKNLQLKLLALPDSDCDVEPPLL